MSQIKPTGDHLNAGSNATPQALGTAGAGTSSSYSRADHVHAMPTASQVGAVSTSQVIDLAHGGTGQTTATAGLSALGGVPLTALGQTVATLNGGQTLTTSQVAALTGDVVSTAGNPATTVVKINGQAVAATPASNGQVLTWSSSAGAYIPGSIPSGGSGGGGLVFFLNAGTAGLSPTTGLPSGTKELGRTAEVAQTTVTSATLSQSSYDLVFGAVSDPLDPDVTNWPAGLFDFNLWISSNANQANQTIVQLRIYKYDGSTATLLATSDDVSVYDPTVTAQYIVSVVLPQTTVNATDRLYIEIRAKATANNRTVTVKFGDSTPSHVHTTIPSVGGSGLVKVINGVMQSPASLLFDADVDASAAIAQSKISGLTTDLASKVNTSQLGALNGVAQLDGSGTLRTSQIPALTTSQIAQITPSAIGAVPTSRTVSTTDGLTGGGALSGNLTLQLTTTGVAAGLYGSTTKIPALTIDDKGRITAASEVDAGGVSLPVSVANGGTGATTAFDALTNLGASARYIDVVWTSGVLAGTMNTSVTPNTFTVTATGAQVADGYTLAAGDVFLFTAQAGGAASAQNGPWQVVTAGDVGVQMVCKRPSWFSGIGKALMVESRIGTTYGGSAWHIVGPSGVTTDFTVGSGVVSAFLFASRQTNATRASNTYSGGQTFVAGAAGGTVPFAFSPGALNTVPVAHRVEWDSTQQFVNCGASFTATISGTTMTVSAVTYGILVPGMLIYGTGITNATITAGPAAGGAGSYTINVSQTVSTGTLTTGVYRQPVMTLGNSTYLPTSSSFPGRVGQMAADASWLYICTASNTWRRAALSTF